MTTPKWIQERQEYFAAKSRYHHRMANLWAAGAVLATVVAIALFVVTVVNW
jgi:hypothetical protein